MVYLCQQIYVVLFLIQEATDLINKRLHTVCKLLTSLCVKVDLIMINFNIFLKTLFLICCNASIIIPVTYSVDNVHVVIRHLKFRVILETLYLHWEYCSNRNTVV